jgi:hypothetical protein
MGKTEAYIAECDATFEGLNIFNPHLNPDMTHAKRSLGEYPTLFISFALSGDVSSAYDSTKPDWEKIKGLIVHRIADLFSEFHYLAFELRRKIKEQLNEELGNRIRAYKQEFKIEHIPPEIQGKIYESIYLNNSPDSRVESQEQTDLETFERLRHGKPQDETELSNSMNFLAQLLSQHHGKPVYILVDEYDSLINKYFDHLEILHNLTQTFSGLFSAFTKPNGSMNDHLKNIIFTGILRVAKANIFSGLNNLKECTVFDKTFSPYYGFTTEEVCGLLERAHKNSYMQDVEKWYNGYKIGGTIIYNPWSVMQFVTSGEFDTYWINTAHPGLIRDIILNNKGHIINNQLRQVIANGVHKTLRVEANKSVSTEDLKNPESIWSFLIHTGYLTLETHVLSEDSGMFECQVRIPNAEVFNIYKVIVHQWAKQNSAITGTIVNIFEQDYEGLADNLHHMLKNTYSSALFAQEDNSVEEVYHSLLLSEFNKETCRSQYELLPEQFSGNGRADILFIDKKNKILVPIELKRAYNIKHLQRHAEEAVHQIVSKKYGQDPKYQNYTHHPAIGISFFGIHLTIKVAPTDSSTMNDVFYSR